MPVLLPGLMVSPTPETVGDFPAEDLELTVEAAFGADLDAAPATWEFTDLSDRVLDTSITVQRGVLVGGRTSRTSSGQVQLLNSDGWLTPHHPVSPWWPYVDAGTPMRVSVRTRTAPILADSWTRTLTDSWGTPDVGGTPWILSNSAAYDADGTTGTVTFTAINVLRRARLAIAHRDVDMVTDFSVAAVASGSAVGIGHYLRGNPSNTDYLWAALDFSTAGTIGLRLRHVTTDIASATQPDLTYAAGTKIRLRTQAIGDRIRMKAWLAAGVEPAAWTIDTTIYVVTGAGTHIGILAWTVGGNTNTLPYTMTVNDLRVEQPRYPRIEGYIADVRPSFQPVGDGDTHSVAIVDIGGVGTILDLRGADPLSPLRRSIQYGAVEPVAYWPLEDSERATSAASGIVGQPAMQVIGPTVFSFDTGDSSESLLATFGSKNLCSVAAGARLSVDFVPSTTANAWTVGLTTNVTAAAVPVTEIRAMEWATGGTFNRWALVSTATGHAVRAYNDLAGTVTTVCASVEAINTLAGYDIQAVQNGGSIDVNLLIDAFTYASGSVAGTLGAPSSLHINPDRANTTGSTNPFGIQFLVGHATVHATATASSLPYYYDGPTLYRGDRGWAEELSHQRIARLAIEGRIPYRRVGPVRIRTALNAQQEGTSADLIAAAVEAESGALLFDDGFGYALLPRSARYNPPVAMTIDMATYRRSDGTSPTDVLQPQLDLRSPTVWTVERTGGSQAVWAASADYRKRRGNLGQKATLDLLLDLETIKHARWRVHLVEDAQDTKYPGASIDLTANPDLIDEWLTVRPGSRIQRTNQPTIAGVGVIDQVVEGLTETIGRRSWTAAVDASPAAPWRVARLGVSVQQPRDTTIQSALTASATTFVLSTPNPRNVWSTTAGMTVEIGGEHITIPPGGIGAVSGAGPFLQTVTGAVRSVNGVSKEHPAGTPVLIADRDWAAL